MNLDILIEILKRLEPDIETITQDSTLADLGLSSLDMMMIICELEQIHGLTIQIDALKGIETVEQLYRAVTEQ